MRCVHPPQLVEVLDAGVWCRGQLEGWRQQDGAWSAYVRWHVAVGLQHLGWVPAGQVRPVCH